MALTWTSLHRMGRLSSTPCAKCCFTRLAGLSKWAPAYLRRQKTHLHPSLRYISQAIDLTAERDAPRIRYGSINYSSRVGGPFEEARINTVKLLLANGCKLKTENSHGRTPLESALHGGLPRTTVHLLDAGALSSGEDVWETL